MIFFFFEIRSVALATNWNKSTIIKTKTESKVI